MYDYLLGGGNNFPADRALVDDLVRASPQMRTLAVENRAFLGRAVRHLARSGIRQFLDIGAGLPSQGNVHEVARALHPGTRVVYVDKDPTVLSYGRSLLADLDGVALIEGDLTAPGDILADPRTRRLLDFTQPIAILMVAMLHVVPDSADPHHAVEQFKDAVEPGSHLVISHLEALPDEVIQVAVRHQSDRGSPRAEADILRFFDGWDVLPPGLVPVQQWGAAPAQIEPTASLLRGAIGAKPSQR